MDKLTIFEQEEFGKDYIIVDVELDDFDFIPGFIRTTIQEIKNYNKFVKVIKHKDVLMEIEYFESSVRSNKKGPALIDRNGKKHFFILGKETTDSEKLQNMDRNHTLRKILDESLEDTEFPRSGF